MLIVFIIIGILTIKLNYLNAATDLDEDAYDEPISDTDSVEYA